MQTLRTIWKWIGNAVSRGASASGEGWLTSGGNCSHWPIIPKTWEEAEVPRAFCQLCRKIVQQTEDGQWRSVGVSLSDEELDKLDWREVPNKIEPPPLRV